MTAVPETPPRSNGPENEPILPQFTSMADPVFTWGEHDATQFIDTVNAPYAEAAPASQKLKTTSYTWNDDSKLGKRGT